MTTFETTHKLTKRPTRDRQRLLLVYRTPGGTPQTFTRATWETTARLDEWRKTHDGEV